MSTAIGCKRANMKQMTLQDMFKPKKPKLDSTATTSPVKKSTETNGLGEKTTAERVAKSSGKSPTKDKPSSSEPLKSSTTASIDEYNPNPSNGDYDPIEDAAWTSGSPVPYACLARTFAAIEEISSRLKIVEVLGNFYRSVLVLSPKDLVACVRLSLNEMAPAYRGIELGVGDSILINVIVECTKQGKQAVQRDYKREGDLGKVAAEKKNCQKTLMEPKRLNVNHVYRTLLEVASISGSKSNEAKMRKINELFVRCKATEAKYLIRSLGGKLRIGLAEQSVLMALAQAVVFSSLRGDDHNEDGDGRSRKKKRQQKDSEKIKSLVEEAVLKVKTAHCQYPDYDRVIGALIEGGLDGMARTCVITPGVPVKPMLAHPSKGIAEVLKRFAGKSNTPADDLRFICEYKYDGMRAQIHLSDGGAVQTFSRNQEENTSAYPDIVRLISEEVLPKANDLRSFVLDTEAVAYDTEKQQILPFQVLTTRKRKQVAIDEVKINVCVFAFDLLYLNGQSLIERPLSERRQLLSDHFPLIESKFALTQHMVATPEQTEEIQQFLDESVKSSCEGLMLKTLDVAATYEIAKRSHNWMKLKKDYLEGAGDTLDLVVIGAYKGEGKRTGLYGGFLLACYNSDEEDFQSICKLGTGFKDSDLQRHFETLSLTILETKPTDYVVPGPAPDVWLQPTEVWEVKAADLSLSPVYAAAAGLFDEGKGISLRFPRFVQVRTDKQPADATSSQQVVEMYRNQDQIQNQGGLDIVYDDDY